MMPCSRCIAGCIGFLTLAALACSPRAVPDPFPTASAASPSAAEPPAPSAAIALGQEPPLPGEDTSGWTGLAPQGGTAADPHAHHRGMHGMQHGGEGPAQGAPPATTPPQNGPTPDAGASPQQPQGGHHHGP